MRFEITQETANFFYEDVRYRGKYYIYDKDSEGMNYLHKDGVVRQSTGPDDSGWFDTPEDVIHALNFFFSKQGPQ